jgi:dTDP-glucose 4,6-dehydratase
MSLLNNQPIPIHGEGKQFREWIYVEDNCRAIMRIIENAPPNEVYNIGSGQELKNMDMVNKIADILNIEPQIKFIPDRAGHDFRYSVNCNKMHRLGWCIEKEFDERLKNTVKWYQDRPERYIEYKDR